MKIWEFWGPTYSKGHKCGEKKLLYIDCEEDEEKEKEMPKGKKKETPEEITPTISCNPLDGITTPQTPNDKTFLVYIRVQRMHLQWKDTNWHQ